MLFWNHYTIILMHSLWASAWIASFKKTVDSSTKEFLQNAITTGIACTAPIIILELLQGCRSAKERDTLRNRLESLSVLRTTDAVWENAYELGFHTRRKGLTLPTVDIIIAAIAVVNGCAILHHDKHFDLMAESYPGLRTKAFTEL